MTDRILSALSTVIRMNIKVEEMANLMKEQQRRLDDLNGRVIRLETALELALDGPSPRSRRPLLDAGSDADGTRGSTACARARRIGSPCCCLVLLLPALAPAMRCIPRCSIWPWLWWRPTGGSGSGQPRCPFSWRRFLPVRTG